MSIITGIETKNDKLVVSIKKIETGTPEELSQHGAEYHLLSNIIMVAIHNAVNHLVKAGWKDRATVILEGEHIELTK